MTENHKNEHELKNVTVYLNQNRNAQTTMPKEIVLLFLNDSSSLLSQITGFV